MATLDEAATLPGVEPPPVAAALPIGPENRSASGEIIVRPTKNKTKHSPAAEVRLAHLREERARTFVRASQSLTPPGSARALDEPPPLLDGPAPEPLQRPTTQLVRTTAVEAAVDAATPPRNPATLPPHGRADQRGRCPRRGRDRRDVAGLAARQGIGFCRDGAALVGTPPLSMPSVAPTGQPVVARQGLGGCRSRRQAGGRAHRGVGSFAR